MATFEGERFEFGRPLYNGIRANGYNGGNGDTDFVPVTPLIKPARLPLTAYEAELLRNTRTPTFIDDSKEILDNSGDILSNEAMSPERRKTLTKTEVTEKTAEALNLGVILGGLGLLYLFT